MTSGISLAAWLFAGYGAALVGIGWIMDLVANRAHKKQADIKRGNFVYHESHDAWLCPEDQWLWPTSYDPDNRIMRYRGNPSICNACPVKDTCTTSNHGRQMVRELDPWPHSETGLFHRGVALAVAAMGVFLTIVAMFVFHTPAELVMLGTVTVVLIVATLPLAAILRRNRANFPEPGHLPERDEEEEVRISANTRYRTSYRDTTKDRTAGGTVYSSSRRGDSDAN